MYFCRRVILRASYNISVPPIPVNFSNIGLKCRGIGILSDVVFVVPFRCILLRYSSKYRLHTALWTLLLTVIRCSHLVVEGVAFHRIPEEPPEWLSGPYPVDSSLVVISTELTDCVCGNENFRVCMYSTLIYIYIHTYQKHTFDLPVGK